MVFYMRFYVLLILTSEFNHFFPLEYFVKALFFLKKK